MNDHTEESFLRERLGVIQSHYQLSLTERSELEAIIERADREVDALVDELAIDRGDAQRLRDIFADPGNQRLREHDARLRIDVYETIAELMPHVVNDDVQAGESDDVRRGYQLALEDVHARLTALAASEQVELDA